jgi:hypothetical protein
MYEIILGRGSAVPERLRNTDAGMKNLNENKFLKSDETGDTSWLVSVQ